MKMSIMSKQILALVMALALLTLAACSKSAAPSSSTLPSSSVAPSSQSEPEPTPSSSAASSDSIEFFGETYLISEADSTTQDEAGNTNFAMYRDRGFVCLDHPTAAPVTQRIKPGDVINGMTVAEGTSMGFDFINGGWELTESDVRLKGPVELTGELTMTPEDELYPAGTLVFTPSKASSSLLPSHFGDNTGPEFIFQEDAPKLVPPGLFSESDTVFVKVTVDNLRLLKTDRMTGGNHAELLSVARPIEGLIQDEYPELTMTAAVRPPQAIQPGGTVPVTVTVTNSGDNTISYELGSSSHTTPSALLVGADGLQPVIPKDRASLIFAADMATKNLGPGETVTFVIPVKAIEPSRNFNDYTIQLFNDENIYIADLEWADLQGRYPDLVVAKAGNYIGTFALEYAINTGETAAALNGPTGYAFTDAAIWVTE